ncbi:hypothetical protein CFC21_102148 [Triticum aestivum]|uniref:NAC domain-containing protein n=3 Tax=Triticum TaxID=4564 RepID=A0A9R0ZW82_TRITD|nr:protein NTM1-like 9 [Triticum aestivum]KAF7100663.1 hypothetical protein CFC21_102148 [Triticum aestivum]VAI85051.1 unnamed protein product [Triticum turgidum subsp. durum]
MEGLDVDDVFHHFRLNPTEVEAVTYYLPRLLSGETLHGADKLIHHVNISGCEPKDLARQFAPVPQAVSSGDRFFFTTCKSKNGSKLQSVRGAGGGTWSIQKTTEICHAGCKVGEVKNLSFKKKGKSTGWVMEEYRCLLPEATVVDGVKVFCKMHLAQHAPDAARQESEAYKLQQQQPEAVTPSTHAQKRPAPAAAADPHPPRPKKRMRGAVPVPVPASATPSFLMYDEAANFPVQDAQASCGSTTTSSRSDVAQAPEISSQSDVLESTQSIPEAGSSIARSTSEENVSESLEPISNLPDWEEDGFDLEELMRMMEDNPIEVEPVSGANTGVEMGQQEPLYLDAFHDADKEKRYNAASDLDAPSLQGQDHLSKPQPCSFDPFEEAWKAEEALEKEKRCNAAANLHTGGHSNFFSPASVY